MVADDGWKDFRPFLRRLLAVALAVALVALALRLAHLLLMVFGGVLFAIGLRAGGEHLHRWFGLPPRIGVFVTLVLVVAFVVLAGWLVGARMGDQLGALAEQIPGAVDHLRGWLQGKSWGNYLLEHGQGITGGQSGVLSGVTGIASSAFGFVTDLVLILVIMVFVAVEPNLYRHGLVRLFPLSARDRVRQVEGAVGGALRGWLWGQGIAMALTGVLTTLGMMLVGAPLPMALGLLSGLLDFIPLVGPILAAAPGLLLAFTDSPRMVLYVALVYLVVQQVEGNVIVPLVQKKAVALPPVLTVVATVALGLLLGFPGMVFATPLVAVVLVVVRMVYVGDVLGDRD